MLNGSQRVCAERHRQNEQVQGRKDGRLTFILFFNIREYSLESKLVRVLSPSLTFFPKIPKLGRFDLSLAHFRFAVGCNCPEFIFFLVTKENTNLGLSKHRLVGHFVLLGAHTVSLLLGHHIYSGVTTHQYRNNAGT